MHYQQRTNRFFEAVCYRIEEIILAVLIILNVLDFFQLLAPSAEYVKEIVSWTALGYLLYSASLTKIFFGTPNKKLDAALIITYFMLIMNKILFYAKTAYAELVERLYDLLEVGIAANPPAGTEVLQLTTTQQDLMNAIPNVFTHDVLLAIMGKLSMLNDLIYVRITNGITEQLLAVSTASFSFTNIGNFIDGALFYFIKLLVDNAILIERTTFYAGCIGLIVLSIYFAATYKITAPSLMHVLHSDKKVRSQGQRVWRGIIIFSVLIGFFIFVFNLVMEWLAIALDAPLIMIAIFSYFFFIIKHHKKFDVESTIYKIGNFGESFYEQFIELFHTKNGLKLGVSGMLVLHMLTDLGIYVIPYTIFAYHSVYFTEPGIAMSGVHQPLFTISDLFTPEKISLLFEELFRQPTLWTKLSAAVIYLLNSIAILFLFAMPAVLWYHAFKRTSDDPHHFWTIFFFSSVITFLVFPLITLTTLESNGLVGVDIQTHLLPEDVFTSGTIKSLLFTVSIPALLLIGWCIHLLYKKLFARKILAYLSIIITTLFFGKYLFYFFKDMVSYYVHFLNALWTTNYFFVWGYSLLFFLFTMAFYVSGFGCYVYELLKYLHVKKWKK